MKPIILSPRQWRVIKQELSKEHTKPILALRSHMKKVLGFVPREHTSWIPNPNYRAEYLKYEHSNKDEWHNVEPLKGNTKREIHLDFYSEHKRTLFLLKFSDIINRSDDGTSTAGII